MQDPTDAVTHNKKRVAPCGREVQARQKEDTVYQLATLVFVILLVMTSAFI